MLATCRSPTRSGTVAFTGWLNAARGPMRRLSVPVQLGASRTRERRHDQVVGVGDQPAYDVVLDRAVEDDGVPVLLVLVVPGTDAGVGVTQLQRPCRVALEVHRLGLPGQGHQGE